MAARFEFQARVGALADDAHDDFLVAADLAGIVRHDFHAPAVALGVAGVHAQQSAGEQRRFVAAGTGADLEEDVAFVVGVARQQRGLQVGFQPGDLRLAVGEFGFGELAHVGVGEQAARGVAVRLDLPVLPVQRDHRIEVGALARELAVAVHVAGDFRLRQQGVEFHQPLVGASELVGKRGFHPGLSNRP